MDEVNPVVREKFSKLGLSGPDKVLVLEALTCLGDGFFGGGLLCTSPARLISLFSLVRSGFLVHLAPLELFGFALGSWSDASTKNPFPDNRPGNTKMFSDCVFAFSVLIHGLNLIDRKIELVGLDVIHGDLKSRVAKFKGESTPTNAYFGSSLFNSCAISYKFDSVVDTCESDFSGHIYNLQSVSGDYTTETSVVSNCRCTYKAIIPEFEDIEN